MEVLGINDWLVQQCETLGIKKPTPVQENCVPRILKGEDVIGCAKTGSGKTAAFALPILNKLAEDPYGIFALVLTPTRELAFQIADQFRVLGKPIGVKDAVITGGMDMMVQGLELAEKPHVVIATPGRLADHIDSGTNFSMKKIKFLVLDEADRLLEDNFGAQLAKIFKILPETRQTLLFSATITPTLQQLQDVACSKPFVYDHNEKSVTVDNLDQRYVLVPAKVKDAYLINILQKFTEENQSSSVMVFTNTCRNCKILAIMCRKLNLTCVEIHSVMKQRQRIASLARFKSQQVRVLIATDVASRGLDIPTVDLVINHNIPVVPKDYVHRVGRTARAGRGGQAISLVTQYDVKLLHAIENKINSKLEEYQVTEKEVLKILTEVLVTRSEAEIILDEEDFGESRQINKRKKMILEGKDPDAVKPKKKKKKATSEGPPVYDDHQTMDSMERAGDTTLA